MIMSTSQGNFNTSSTLTQEQRRNAERLLKRILTEDADIPNADALPDTGALDYPLTELLRARLDADITGVKRAYKALSIEYPVLTELAKPNRYKPLAISALMHLPPQDWLLTNFLYDDAISVLYGLPGSAKSFIALDWAIHMALGRAWKGRAVKQCRVVYLAAEGIRGYQRRILAWCKQFGASPGDIERYLAFIPCAVPLGNKAEVEMFVEAIQDYTDSYTDGLPVLIVLDTIFRCTAGQNINATDVVTGLIASVEKVKEETKAAHILLVHHSGKDTSRGMSGNIAFKGSTDLSYYVEKDRDGLITVTSDKVKDDEDVTTYLSLQRVEYGDGARDNSCVILAREAPEKPTKAAPGLKTLERKMLEALPDTGDGLRNSDWQKALAASSVQVAPRSFQNWRAKLIDGGYAEDISQDDTPRYLRTAKGSEALNV